MTACGRGDRNGDRNNDRGDRAAADAYQDHPRSLADTRFAYAVLSRRAGGISVGVNLNPDKACNFDCVYCQVDRSTPGRDREVDPRILAAELDMILGAASDGTLYDHAAFRHLPAGLRRVVDIAFSGDGEPTTSRRFGDAIAIAIDARERHGRGDLPIRIITNATGLGRAGVRETLDRLHGAGPCEVWAKLDAGTADAYRRVARSAVPFERVVSGIVACAQRYPTVIQSLFFRVGDDPPSPAEIDEWTQRLAEITAAGGTIRQVQVYTVARRPAESWVAPLAADELSAIADRVRALGIPAEVYGAPGEGDD